MDLMVIFGIFLIFSVALIFSPLGLGGGVLYVPILHYLLEWSIEESILGSLSLVFMVALGSGFSHLKQGFADKKIATLGRFSAIPGAIVGAFLASSALEIFGDSSIKILAVIILGFVIVKNVGKLNSLSDSENTDFEISNKKGLYLLGTSFAGITSGLLGIGGGAILVTLNRNLLKMNQHKSAGTSYLVGATIVPVALISHIILGEAFTQILDNINLIFIFIILIMAFTCSIIGSRYAILYIPRNYVSKVFLFAVSLSIFRYLIDIIGLV
tara:strand:+ start:206 stop:1015 length:810 start_codon:yes stop_codon:yes gene_type:complete